jgi:Reverse transcriptase (RNA-dependent DNA polymerase)
MKKNKGWYKPKGYLHITSKLRKGDENSVLEYIQTKLQSHNFFPLIHETLSTRRYKKLANGERSHFDYFSAKAKPTAKNREIFYANHLDAHIYSYYANEVLGPIYKTVLEADNELNKSVIAYRRIPVAEGSDSCKCNIHFAKEVFDEVKRRTNCFAVCYDIENFFPTLNHKYLKKCWCDLLNVDKLDEANFKIFKSITNYSYVEIDSIISACSDKERGLLKKHDFIDVKPRLKSYFLSPKDFRDKIAAKKLIKVNPKDKQGNQKGIPQGTPISAFLANLYLLQFDRYIIEEYVKKAGCFYRRYSDDIILVFDTEAQFTKFDEDISKTILSVPFQLTINSSKTIISKFQRGEEKIICSTKTEETTDFTENIPLRYLGFDFNGERTFIKDASVSNYYRELKKSLRAKGNRVKAAKKFNSKFPKLAVKDTKLYLTKLYQRFTHLGKTKTKSNFLTYADRSAKVMYPDTDTSKSPIRGQVKRSWSIFNKTADRYR